jgi:hypothetical protein
MKRVKFKHLVYGALLLWVITLFSNPLRKSETYIREYLLKLTPLGTDMDDVIDIIKAKNKWKIFYVDNSIGYYLSPNGRPSEGARVYPETSIVGKKSIRVVLGIYGLVFKTGVSAYYGFDEMNLLIEISIKKDTDTL